MTPLAPPARWAYVALLVPLLALAAVLLGALSAVNPGLAGAAAAAYAAVALLGWLAGPAIVLDQRATGQLGDRLWPAWLLGGLLLGPVVGAWWVYARRRDREAWAARLRERADEVSAA